MEILNKYPVMLEDKSIKEVKAILKFESSTVKASFEVTLPREDHEKKFAETLSKCEDIIYSQLYKDKAEDERFEKLNDAIAKSKLQYDKVENMTKLMSATVNDLIAMLGAGGKLNDTATSATTTTSSTNI
ncbi:DUF1366 domain-containing protein [Streptococcus agalactiae]|uniref:DUF1366 domain-containing protein n=1 Tax=Streptococcus agalactiae TaxID=1311 RepID=UPI00255396CF|nr:DUF1366 domain-containing protein [Streptococcus agalactiae]MCC9934224.1 DUF1366 domain-containing protein [Streptococcus agalactiae]MCC9955282.1 DUF1366 domain-containing protein [Streptococcus agalactiae]MDK7174809.1 DUF1366 domain-containing protein [Streptococcus agalactiae]HEM9252452.1 DUF1366 domain-containing protein [Streptococcus agalactiae]HEN9259374.1 DUF1366 domain-containing protein [Streptococcus agalactiae]